MVIIGQLLELSEKINVIIAAKNMDKGVTRGKIGLKSGVLMSFNERTPDDPVKLLKIKMAAKEILGTDVN